jgi:hypothetical protein
MDYLQRRRAGLDQMDEDVREVQADAKRENDRHGVLEAVKTRAGIVGKQLQLADLLGRATGEFGGAAPVQQNIVVQVLSLPKIGESLPNLDGVIEAAAAPLLPGTGAGRASVPLAE